MVGLEIKYRSRLHREEKELLAMKLRTTHDRIAYGVIILIILVGAGALVWQQRSRRQKAERNHLIEQVNTLSEVRRELNDTVARLQEEIAQSGQNEIDQVILEKLTASLLEKEAEINFRKSFSQAYPQFVKTLSEKYPALTPGNQLICMLIFLNQTTDEISLTLGISRDSVIKARYRIRQRMALTNDIDLDKLIRSLARR